MKAGYLYLILSLSMLQGFTQHTIRGTILNQEGRDVGFCHVYNKTLDVGKVADLQGRFELTARRNDTVEFSYVGYVPLEVVIDHVHLTNFMKITMTEDSILLPSIRIYADRYYKVPVEVNGPPIFLPGVTIVNPPDPIKAGDIRAGTDPMMDGGIPGGGFTLYGPITYFSRDEREKRKAEFAYKETRETITYQKYIAQDTVKAQLVEMYKLTEDQYDEVLVRLHQFWPGIQRSYRPREIWNWLLIHFDRTVPIVKQYSVITNRE